MLKLGSKVIGNHEHVSHQALMNPSLFGEVFMLIMMA